MTVAKEVEEVIYLIGKAVPVSSLHAKVSLGVVLLNPKFLSGAFIGVLMLDKKSLYEWLNEACCVNCFECSNIKAIYIN